MNKKNVAKYPSQTPCLPWISYTTQLLIIISNNSSSVQLENPFSKLFQVFIWWKYWLIGLVGRVFANGPGDLVSIPGRVIPKTLKMVLETSLLNTQQYKIHIEGKVDQSREWSSALPYT